METNLLHLETLLRIVLAVDVATLAVLLRCGARGVGHIDVSHGGVVRRRILAWVLGGGLSEMQAVGVGMAGRRWALRRRGCVCNKSGDVTVEA